MLGSIDDVRLLGDAAFSQCRYITHWAYSLEHVGVEWIVTVLRRIEELAGGAGRQSVCRHPEAPPPPSANE